MATNSKSKCEVKMRISESFFIRSKRKRLLFWALWKFPLTRKEINDLNIELFVSGTKKVRKPKEAKDELREIEKLLKIKLTKKDKKRRKAIRDRLRYFKDTGMVKVLPELLEHGWIEKQGKEYRATHKYFLDVLRAKYDGCDDSPKGFPVKMPEPKKMRPSNLFSDDPSIAFDAKLANNWISKEDLDQFEAFLPKIFEPPEYNPELIPPKDRVSFLLFELEGAEHYNPFGDFLKELEKCYVLAVRDRKLYGSRKLAKQMLSFLPIVVFARGYESGLKHFLFLTPEGKMDAI